MGETYKYICRGCQTDPDGNPQDKVRDDINDVETAELLAKIHRIQNGGHDPTVMADH